MVVGALVAAAAVVTLPHHQVLTNEFLNKRLAESISCKFLKIQFYFPISSVKFGAVLWRRSRLELNIFSGSRLRGFVVAK